VRWTVALGARFDERAFETALAGFRRLYNFAALMSRSPEDAMNRDLLHDGVPVVSAILAPGTIVFEGEVDEERMGDW
jgi:hypothetical protein